MVKKLEIEEKILQQKHQHGIHTHDDLVFPKDFLWGTSTSAHQVEGNNEFNDWHVFEQVKGNIYRNQKSGTGPDHYHLYKKDFEILDKVLHNNAHRFSIEWSRIEPQEGNYHKLHVDHYHHVFQELKKRGIKIMLTLNHFTLPYWFYARGGWLQRNALQKFQKFVEFCVKEYGKYVDFWITINEPMVYVTQSYLNGEWPPAKNSFFQAWRCYRKLIKAHKVAYQTIHKLRKRAKVGVAKSVIVSSFSNKHSFMGQTQEYFADLIWNHRFLDQTKGYHDFIGINFYLYQRLVKRKIKGGLTVATLDIRGKARETSDLGWEINPQGIYEAIVDMADYHLPIYITENGIATRNDNVRIRYIISYLMEVYNALEEGVPVKGYFYWSLLDNFEWDKGYDPKFGLVGFDRKTLKRQIKKSAKIYGHIAKTNKISHDLMKYVGHGVR